MQVAHGTHEEKIKPRISCPFVLGSWERVVTPLQVPSEMADHSMLRCLNDDARDFIISFVRQVAKHISKRITLERAYC